MSRASIRIRGARQNNLRGVSVDVPRERLTVITGVSGSGKSSLAFDTLFREGERRFLQTLSAYARQFLGRLEKPDVESIDGLSPAIAVDQKTAPRGARSTVGTLTEITDHLRVLFARAGTAHCPKCDLPIQGQTADEIQRQVLAEFANDAVLVLAPKIRDRKGSHRALFDELKQRGFVRARVDGAVKRIEEVGELARYERHTIEVVVDRLKPDPADPSRLREALAQALELGEGELVVQGSKHERAYSTSRACAGCGADVPPLEPRLFSSNSPHGACPTCQGLGLEKRVTEARLVVDPRLSVRQGALAVTRKSGGAWLFPKVEFRFLEQIAKHHGFDLDTPWKELSKAAKKILLHGTGDERFEDTASWAGEKYQGSVTWQRRFRGVIPAIEKARASGNRLAERFLVEATCRECNGSRLKPAARAVRFAGTTIDALQALPIAAFSARIRALKPSAREERIARDLLAEIQRRAEFLDRVGLEYLTLSRAADTLSGGEAQRIRLAAQLASGLQGVLYVLDEPSIGLHARDHGRLLGALERLRDGGNTVVVVEHDESTLRAADWVIDVGPLAGKRGGEIVTQGTPGKVARGSSPTAKFLRGELELPAPHAPRVGNGKALTIRGARAFNLKDVDVTLPLGTFTVIAGVSGSGKSTLLNRILLPAVLKRLEREGPEPLEHDRIEGLEHVDDLVAVDAAPIGRTPRSNPATYTDALTAIRDLFATLPDAKMRGYTKSRFSFNVAGGRCEACGGAGAQLVELQFLAPVTVPCDQCGGERFQAETLEVRYRDKSIADVLSMTVDDAFELFKDHPLVRKPLETMVEIGLGYLTLGQPSTTLSGGEAQRLKLALELKKSPKSHTLYLLDEPTTGLHQADVQKLVGALQKLVDRGHSVIVIEHNLDVVRAADHVIELGPEGGAAGGRVVASGTPADVERVEPSPTGAALRELRAERKRRVRDDHGQEPATHAPETPDVIDVVGARTHNLQNVSVSIPRDALTVITGPSGSGKSSLALDTIYAEGRRRFVESLSTYARQFLGLSERPPVERITGLGPSVAVEAGTSRGHPRSTVATTTEIHDHLRVLFARAAEVRCPTHAIALEAQDPGSIAKTVVRELAGEKGWVLAPIFVPDHAEPDDPNAALAQAVPAWRAAGFVRALVDGEEVRLDGELPRLARGVRVDLVIDRMSFDKASRGRIAEAAEQAAEIEGGRVSVLAKGGTRLEFSTRGACPTCGFRLEHKLDPRHFSFNTHAGACSECDGLGLRVRCDPELLIRLPNLSLLDGAIPGKLGSYLTKGKGYYEFLLREVAKQHDIQIEKPFEKLSLAARELLVRGVGAKDLYKVTIEKSWATAEIQENFSAPWPGLAGHIDAWHKKTEDPEWAALLEKVMVARRCDACDGERLRPEARAAVLAARRLPEVLGFSVERALAWLATVDVDEQARAAVGPVIDELRARLGLLERVGLGYLTLDRSTSTLSGGEARRVRLSASLGSKLVGVCYVLDEPTVGLHPGDVDKLTNALLELRDGGNTVIVVEHDESLMRRADCIVDLGPRGGRSGGRVMAVAGPKELVKIADAPTAKALRGEYALTPSDRKASKRGGNASAAARAFRRNSPSFVLQGATLFNLKDVDFAASFGELVGVCGPSGSGKSTLILDTLVPALQGERPEGRWKRADFPRGRNFRTVIVDAAPLGRTPASTPATYTGLLELLRELFAKTPEARMAGLTPSHFSFNSPRGRCRACEGRGATLVEMQFLPDLWLTCEECGGKRYAPEVLDVRWRSKSIADVLDMTIEEAREFLAAQPRAQLILTTLCDVGLGYVTLGQSAMTLSGGEAQRVKLASELYDADALDQAVIVLDEPTTGLHASDVHALGRVLDRLAAEGHAVIVIEHHTGLLSVCDRLVELGPGGGEAGGRIVAVGTPEELARNPDSPTGPWIAREFERDTAASSRGSARGRSNARGKGGRAAGVDSHVEEVTP
ncbi:MAG: excinuclease ABC subunit UvrA [Planctomycetes bacterium]|nr:excinuclease ABC subunit UvrA [Planctomycetota bacterium]